MALFRCTAVGCSRVTNRRRPPADCLSKDRCQFDEDVAADLPAPLEPEKNSAAPELRPPLESSSQNSAPLQALARLALIIGGRTHEITGTTVLGRNGDLVPELFREDTSLSRRHCLLEVVEDRWLLTALSASSPTRLDTVLLEANVPVPLHDGIHKLQLGATFELDLRLASSNQSDQVFLGELDEFFR